MEYVKHYQLIKLNSHTEEYTLVVYLADHASEFADELGTLPKTKNNLTTTVKQILKERYPNIKIMISGVAITTIPIMANTTNAHAAESNVTTSPVTENSFYYNVVSGDSLWAISQKFITSIDLIRRANNLMTDSLQLN
ncbi:LysM peptidoglycan-binding domain-containing protein [Radiobacillus sp. PE A8.2]|uniref:LysM peptidoglycan-binding domain-containing protein n=1 Tax=Radiobacillus sp. PE A8.2 TaxID=3380349 RepID=UPI003890C05B